MNALFFDLDGTLIDSKTDLAIAINHTRCTIRTIRINRFDELLRYCKPEE